MLLLEYLVDDMRHEAGRPFSLDRRDAPALKLSKNRTLRSRSACQLSVRRPPGFEANQDACSHIEFQRNRRSTALHERSAHIIQTRAPDAPLRARPSAHPSAVSVQSPSRAQRPVRAMMVAAGLRSMSRRRRWCRSGRQVVVMSPCARCSCDHSL